MTPSDPRIPVRLAPAASVRPGETVLEVTTTHAAGCACCGGRSGAAIALSALFVRAARGEIAWFSGVVADVAGMEGARLAEALVSDRFLAGRYRVADD